MMAPRATPKGVEMISRGRRVRRGDPPRRGQSLVELALLLPLLALIMLGTIDLGRAFFAYQRLTNAVKEGALYGVRYPTHLTATSTNPLNNNSANPNNIVYQVRQESAAGDGTADPNLTITVVSSSGSDILCYEGRSTTLLATGNFPGDCKYASTGDTIQVRATYAFQPFTKQIIGIVGAPLQMRATVRMVII
jgi:Flp pilus assembly protein TadG